MIIAAITPLITPYLGKKIFLFLPFVPLLSLVVLLRNWPSSHGSYSDTYAWISDLSMEIDFRFDPTSAIFSLLILGIGTLVLFYCYFYFSDQEPKLGIIAGQLLAFCGSMFGLVVSDNLLLMYAFWESTTILSYFMIGHYSDQVQSRRSANRALLITSSGGLTMLVGIILIANVCGTYSITEIVAIAPDVITSSAKTATLGIILLAVGAFSKSALFPFHFWLPGAMVAPTPVSAYLHAAAMVKAGIYLGIRITSFTTNTHVWTYLACAFGGFTMLLGGWRALHEKDLKLILAFGTVSQLGFIMALTSIPGKTGFMAAITIVLAHGLFKSTLFMGVGLIDHAYGTRMIDKLSGVRKRMPWLTLCLTIAGFSMMGLPPFIGFVGKETGLEAISELPTGFNIFYYLIFSLGSVLTVAYTLRFLCTGFADKTSQLWKKYFTPIAPSKILHSPSYLALTPLVILSFFTIYVGINPNIIKTGVTPHFSSLALAAALDSTESEVNLALWHGFNKYLLTSLLIILGGIILFCLRIKKISSKNYKPALGNSDKFYDKTVMLTDDLSVWLTKFYQRGSLSSSIGLIFATFIIFPLIFLFTGSRDLPNFRIYDHPIQIPIALAIVLAVIFSIIIKSRIASALLIGVSGYGLTLLYAIQSAPDLALTQGLVETVTLIILVLVFRKLPLSDSNEKYNFFNFAHDNIRRFLISFGVMLLVFLVGAYATASRSFKGIYQEIFDKAQQYGYGKNIVNVILVDVRSWDTIGEVSVLIVAATGITSLIYISSSNLRNNLNSIQNFIQQDLATNSMSSDRTIWLRGSVNNTTTQRSIIVETLTRTIFPTMVVLSFYLFFAGHNAPGGGFAGGLVAGIALILRYLAGGKYEILETIPYAAGKLLGIGILISIGVGLIPILFGNPIFTSGQLSFTIPIFGNVHLVSASIFDLGVYLIVLGLILDILRCLGVKLGEADKTNLASKTLPVTDLLKGGK